MSEQKSSPPRLAYRFDEWCGAVGISRSQGYKKVAEGEIQTYMEGRKRMVSATAAARYVAQKEAAA